jgi:hypothetical protein
MRNVFAFLRRAATIAAVSLAFTSGSAHAGCGTIWTLNMTDHWMWVTIYDLGKLQHLDWGWVAPHNLRAWHAGGAPTPQSYMCGSYYHVRAEVKSGTGANPDGGNIFDTEMQINPQLKDWWKVVGSFVINGLTCATGGEVACAVKWGLNKGISMAAFGNESTGGITCLMTHDNKNFFLVENDSCGDKNAKPAPPKITLKVLPRVGPGRQVQNTNVFFNNDHQMVDVLKKGKWSTPTPKIVKFIDDTGRYQVIGKGKGTIVWTFAGKAYSASFDSI